MIYSILQSLDKDWSTDDTPQYWQGLIDDPSYYCTWKDVEYCLNHPEQFKIQFINRVSGTFEDYPVFERAWGHPVPDTATLVNMFNDGHNLIINEFDFIDQKRQQIMQSVEETFPAVQAGMHIYAGLGDTKSFRIHEDFANNFIIQVEGETHWKVYSNRCSNLMSQRHNNPEHDYLDCAIDVIMTPGDMLYIPARCYHQAEPSGKRLSVSIPMQHMCPLKPRERRWYEIL